MVSSEILALTDEPREFVDAYQPHLTIFKIVVCGPGCPTRWCWCVEPKANVGESSRCANIAELEEMEN